MSKKLLVCFVSFASIFCGGPEWVMSSSMCRNGDHCNATAERVGAGTLGAEQEHKDEKYPCTREGCKWLKVTGDSVYLGSDEAYIQYAGVRKSAVKLVLMERYPNKNL